MLEDRDEFRDNNMTLVSPGYMQRIEGQIVVRTTRSKNDDIVAPRRHEPLGRHCEVAVWVQNSNPLVVFEVSFYEVGQQCRFSSTGSADGHEMVASVISFHAKDAMV